MPQLRGRLLANQSLAELTWFRVGGPAQVLFIPADEDDLAYFLKLLPKQLPVYVVGVGSNLIVRDGGMEGVVIRLSPRAFGETSASGDIVRAGTAAAAPALPGHSRRARTLVARGPSSPPFAATEESVRGSLFSRTVRVPPRPPPPGAGGACGNAYEPPGPARP